jgi:hypothetical protein
MKILSPFERTSTWQLRAGDLVRPVRSRAFLGLVLHVEEGKRVTIGVLDDAGRAPFWMDLNRDMPFVRYPDSWVLELPPEDHMIGSNNYWDTPGAVHLSESGLTMNFSAPDRSDIAAVNVGTWAWDQIGQNPVAFPRWTIWASEEDIRRPGARPILRFAAADRAD